MTGEPSRGEQAHAPEASPPEPLVAELRDRLCRAVDQVCPAWLRSRRDDIVQEAIMRTVRSLERGGPPPSAAYLRKAAYSALVDEIRRYRRQEVPREEGDPEARAADAHANPERAVHAADIRRGIRDCIGGLNDPRRRAVTLYLTGHGATEIASLLDWPYKRAENHVYRGLSDLRGCLDGKGLSR